MINVHPTEEKVIYCSGKTVIVRDLTNPTECFVYKGHNERTTVAEFSPNGYWIASGDASGKVRVWSYDNPEHTLKLETHVFAGEVKDLAWGPESKRIVAAGDGRGQMIKAFTWDTGNSLGELVGPQKRVLSVDYKSTRPYRIMSASEDFNVCYFEGPPFKFKQSLSGNHSNFVNCIRYSPDGSKAVSVGSDKKMFLYDGKTGDLIDTFPEEHTISIYSVTWSPDGTQLLTSSGDQTVKLWDVASKSVVQTFTFSDQPDLSHMQVGVAWTKSFMLSLSLSGHINYLDPTNPSKPSKVLHGHQVSLMAVAQSQNSLITGSYDGTVCAWKDGTPSTVGGLVHTAKISSISAALTTSDFASTGWDDTVRFGSGDQYIGNSGLNGQPNGVSICTSDPSIVVVSTSKSVTLLRNQQAVFSTPEFSWTPTCVTIAADGSQVAVGSQEDMKIHLFDVSGDSLVESGEISGHRGALTCVAYSPDGTQLAAGDSYREVRVWDVASRSAVVESMWVYHTTRVTSISWHPSGQFVASGSLDEFIYIWNVSSPMKRVKFEYAHKDGVTGVVFIDSDNLISIGNDGCVNTWDCASLG